MKLKCFFILLCLIFLKTAVCQNQANVNVFIQLLDAKTGSVITDANVISNNSSIGVSSTETGLCELMLKSFPASLIVTHISYINKKINITRPGNDTLIVLLEPKVSDLDEVNIVAKPKTTVFPGDFAVMDFEISNGLIFGVGSYINDTKNLKLLILNNSLEAEGSINLPDTIKAVGIFKDCLENCHILTEKAAYQFIKMDTVWLIYDRCEINKFHDLMDDCLFQVQNKLIFKRVSNEGFSQSFYAIDRIKKTITQLIHNNDWERLKLLTNEVDLLYLSQSRDMDALVRFEKNIMYRPYNDTLIKLGDTIFHISCKDSMINYISGQDLSIIGNTVLDKSITSSIWNDVYYVDEPAKKIYLIHHRKLKEFDPLSGKISLKKKVRFADKIIIDKGYIYYLYKDSRAYNSYKKVIRELLE